MKKLLIVIDMQNDFVDCALANPAAQAIVTPIANYIQAFDGDVIATRDTHQSNYLKTAEGARLPIVHCVHGTHGWEIAAEISAALTAKNARLIDKPTFGFLGWNGLDGYYEAELVGTCTDICVVSNALILKAKYPNLTVKTRKALCAGTSQANHDAAIQVMQACQVEIV